MTQPTFPPISMPIVPVVYQTAYEIAEENETETQEALLESLRKITETTFKDSGHATRSVHAKSHGLLQARLQVLDNLPAELAQGIFSQVETYPAVIRLSTTPGDILDDKVSTPRGMAIKIIGVKGERLEGSENDNTQDFILVNGPAFLAPTAKKFLGSLKLLASTTDKAPGLKQALSAAMRGLEKIIEAAGSESGTVKSLGGHPETHILGETFYSQVPVLFGSYIAKISVAPLSPNLELLKNTTVELKDKPDGLREAVVNFFATNTAVWEVRVQLCTDIKAMPIEDASVTWSEDESPYIPVAHIVAEPQQAWSEALSQYVDDSLSFSPWHGIQSHRPLGSIMRVRKAAYEMSAEFRAKHNGKVIKEPVNLNEFPTQR